MMCFRAPENQQFVLDESNLNSSNLHDKKFLGVSSLTLNNSHGLKSWSEFIKFKSHRTMVGKLRESEKNFH